MEFSKKMYIINLFFIIAITILSFIIIIFSGKLEIIDLSPINTILTTGFAELSVHTGFMLYKSKCENVIKIAKTLENENISSEKLQMAKSITEKEENIFN